MKQGHEALDTYCVNLNARARAGKIDPLVTAKKLKALREGADLASSRL